MSNANSDIPATAVNRRGKFFRLLDDTILPFTTMLNINGKVTDNPDDCILAVYQLPGGLFRGVDLRLFEREDMMEVSN